MATTVPGYWFAFVGGKHSIVTDDMADCRSALDGFMAAPGAKGMWMCFAVQAPDIDAAEAMVHRVLAGENVPTTRVQLA